VVEHLPTMAEAMGSILITAEIIIIIIIILK
jgi:hypothetical protein